MENASTCNGNTSQARRRALVELIDDEITGIYPLAETHEENERIEKIIRERLAQ